MPIAGVSEISGIICAPLMAQSVDQLLIDMHRAKKEGADVAEIRLDCVINFQPRSDLQLLLENRPLPIVVSFGPTREASEYNLDEQERLEVLLLAGDLGADYIDVESKVASALIKDTTLSRLSSSKIIVSFYADSLTSLKDLNHLVSEMAPNVDIMKIVSNAANITELATIFDFLSHGQVPTIAFCTGERGLISHLLSFKYGGAFSYGYIDGNAVPGLPSIESLRQYYDVKNIDKDTVVFGLISKPVSHSKGPILHNPSFRAVGYNGIYVPMLVDNLKEFFSVYTTPEFAGFSVGIPYKEAVVDFCDELHPLAQSIGAVNTIIRNPSNGKLVGYNTDCEAAITAIEDALKTTAGCREQEASVSSPLTRKLFVVVGAGGAGRAICFGAKTRGARVILFDRNFDRAKSLAAEASAEALPFEDLLSFYPEKGAILANATCLGMHPNTERIPVPQDTLGDYKLVFDAVYTPRNTKLLMEAEAAGAVVVGGVEMFLRQAAAQFSLFTGRKAPVELMRQIILEKF